MSVNFIGMVIIYKNFEIYFLVGLVIDIDYLLCFVCVYEEVGFDWVLVLYYFNGLDVIFIIV